MDSCHFRPSSDPRVVVVQASNSPGWSSGGGAWSYCRDRRGFRLRTEKNGEDELSFGLESVVVVVAAAAADVVLLGYNPPKAIV